MRAKDVPRRGEVLVAIMRSKRDFAILRDELWYRVPVDTAPRRWPPEWLAFYQTKIFGKEAYAINYHGRVRHIRVRRRDELFPNEPRNPKSSQLYYQVHLHSLEPLPQPIFSRRFRRVVFIPTTWDKFERAAEINDLFDESPLEDRLWAELKRHEIAAQRQWALHIGKDRFFLDFAVFCTEGKIDVEADGVSYHLDPERWARDRRRDTRVQADGWRVLRFTGEEIREQVGDYCIGEITRLVDHLGGLTTDGLVPRGFYQTPEGVAQQLALFEEDVEYDVD